MNSLNMYSNYDTRNYTQPRQRMSKPFCKVCFQAGFPPEQYNSHYVRENPSPTSKVVCPTLLSLKCNYCKNTGHTISHCPILAEKKKCNSRDDLKKHVLDERYKRTNTRDVGNNETQTKVKVATVHDNELYGMTQEQIEEILQEEEMLDDIERMMKEDEIHHERTENPDFYAFNQPIYYGFYTPSPPTSPIQNYHDDTYHYPKRRRIIVPTITTYDSSSSPQYSSAMDNYIQRNFNEQEVNNLNYDFQIEVDEYTENEHDDSDIDLMEVDDTGSIS